MCNRWAAFNALIFALLCAAAGSGRAADELHQRPPEPFHAGPAVWLEEYWDVKRFRGRCMQRSVWTHSPAA